MSTQQADTRRPGAVRTAWVLAGVALLVYAGFILSGVVSSGVLGGGGAP